MRPKNWPELLAQYLTECGTKPFKWGEQDCCLIACDWVKLVTGIDPAENFRDRYHDARGALTVIAEYGDLEALAVAMANQYGFEEVPVNFAQSGDVVVVKSEETETGMGTGYPTLGIMGADGRCWVPASHGLVSVPRSFAVRAFRI